MEHNCVIFDKKYSIAKLGVRRAANLQLKVITLLACLEKGSVTDFDSLFDIGTQLLQYTTIDGKELSTEKEVEEYYDIAGIEELNLAMFEAIRASFPNLMGKLDLNAVKEKINKALAASPE